MIAAGVDTLTRRRPEWLPWLSLVGEALRETTSGRWEAALPEAAADRAEPRLSGASVRVDGASVHRLFRRLIDIAGRSGTARMATLERLRNRAIDPAALFHASICLDAEHISGLAEISGADPEALQAAVALVAMPFLQACNRRWSATGPRNWSAGYCPVCASWPAFAEVRGIERSRHSRCGRCGAEWYAEILHCAYCGNNSHDDLVTLVPEQPGPGSIEACKRCSQYMKVFTRLQGCRPDAVMLEDLGSVDLDVAALGLGYGRPSGPGRAIEVTVHA